jgi:hypothetical protein
MERIGIAASKIAKGNLVAYNLSVIGISCLCSVLIFFVCGCTVLIALLLISFIFRSSEFNSAWPSIMKVVLIALAGVIGVLNIVAIIKNIKITKRKI